MSMEVEYSQINASQHARMDVDASQEVRPTALPPACCGLWFKTARRARTQFGAAEHESQDITQDVRLASAADVPPAA
jgi:hypothetical protein